MRRFLSLSSAAILAAMFVPSAQAALKCSSGTNAEFTPAENNVLLGRLATSAAPRGNEGASTTSVLTDGVASLQTKNPPLMYTYTAGSFVYSLGSSPFGYNVKAINTYGGWANGWRGHQHLSKVEYKTVANPEWTQLYGSVYVDNKAAINYIKFYDDAGADIIEGATDIRITYAVCNNGYHGLTEIEVSATEVPAPDYLQVTDATLANRVTGSTEFINDATLSVVNVPTVADSDRFAFDSVLDFENIDSLAWTEELPETAELATPGANDADVVGYLWYRNSADETWVPRVSASQTLRYTTAVPSVSAKDVDLTMFEGDSIALHWASFDTGSTGGVSSGDGLETLDIPVYSHTFELASGDQTAFSLNADGTATISKGGTFVLRYTVMNDAGNTATSNVSVTVEEVPLGAISWTGAASNDWNSPANWAPSVVPRPDDEIGLFLRKCG